MVRIRENEKLPKKQKQIQIALAGNRTRASRVAGENSNTEPPVPTQSIMSKKYALAFYTYMLVEKSSFPYFPIDQEKKLVDHIYFFVSKNN